MKGLNIAMIQLGNYFDNQEKGFEVATKLIEKAANDNAAMCLLPELSSCGYIPNQTIWKYAEPMQGKTANWICQLSKKLKIYIGAGFIELYNNDFYNSYIISNPNGEISGIIRKEDAESYCFKRERGDVYIDTEIGRIGIGICADNHYSPRLKRIKKENVDIMLMPHANPCPYKTSKVVSKKDIDMFKEQPILLATQYSKYLGIPTVYINPVGDFPEFMGGIGASSFNNDFKLLGGSLAVDENGKLLAKMDDKEEYQIVIINLKKSNKPSDFPIVYNGKWLHKGNFLYRRILLPYTTKKGIRSYNKNHIKVLSKIKNNAK